MMFTVKRETFLKALQTADKAVPSRTTKDIIKNVKLDARTNAITLIGTDTEIGIRVEVSDVVRSDAGVCLLPTNKVLQVLNAFGDGDVDFEVGSDAVWIRGGGPGTKAEFRFPTEDPDGFPDVKGFTEDKFFTVKAGDLRRLIRRTLFATDTESTRVALGGIQVEFNIDKRVNFVATDSRRLSVDVAPFDATGGPQAPAVAPVIPAKAMKLIAATIEESGDVQVAFNGNGVAVRSGLVTITSQLVQGRFPDWRKVMPGNPQKTIDFVVGPLLSAIRQAMVMRSESSRAVEFAFAKGTLKLTSSTEPMPMPKEEKKLERTLLSDGETLVKLPIGYDGEDISIDFDSVYFSDVLKVLDSSSQVQFKLISREDPGLLVAGDYKYIVMPISRDR